MFKKLSLLAILASATLLLSACGFNPQTSSASPTTQCRSLQHQMLFAGTMNPAKADPVTAQNERQQLQQQFQSMHCYSVLERARADQTQK